MPIKVIKNLNHTGANLNRDTEEKVTGKSYTYSLNKRAEYNNNSSKPTEGSCLVILLQEINV